MEKLTNVFKIEYTKGDTYALAIKFKNITEDLSKAFLTVKENPDDSPIIQKSLGKGIDKIDDRAYKNEKTYKFQLQPADTVNIEPKVQYLYDIQVTVGSVVKTVLHGVFVLNSTITGTSQITTPTLEVEIDDELETELATTPATDGIEYEQDPVACAKIGDLSSLTTNQKGTVVGAVNEVKTEADQNKTNIGSMPSLTTTEKASLVGAVNEVKTEADQNKTNIGSMSSLKTTEKTSLVGAVNEVKDQVDGLLDADGVVKNSKKVNGIEFSTDLQDVLYTGDPDEFRVVAYKRALWSGHKNISSKSFVDIISSSQAEALYPATNIIEIYTTDALGGREVFSIYSPAFSQDNGSTIPPTSTFCIGFDLDKGIAFVEFQVSRSGQIRARAVFNKVDSNDYLIPYDSNYYIDEIREVIEGNL